MERKENAGFDVLEAAAVALTRGDFDSQAAGLLRYLGYDDADPRLTAARVRMLRAGASFRRMFQFPAPDAPGLIFFGAEADPARLGSHNTGLPVGGVAGSGLDIQPAFESCVGEGVEYLSQFLQPGDQVQHATFNASAGTLDPTTRGFVRTVLSIGGIPEDRAIRWIKVQRLSDQERCLYPVDLCLRGHNPDFMPSLKLSTGCAAGPTLADATLRGMLELIERDALALWWRGGRLPRAIAANTEAAHAASALLARLRCGLADRRTQLLDITTDLRIPVVVAFSSSPDGYGLALGVASRTTLEDAAQSAIFEMCQSELSLHVIQAKRVQSGQAALNASDLQQYDRATKLDAHQCLLLRPDKTPAATVPAASLETVAQRLAEHGIVAYTLDLTRPQFAVPVVRVIAPALQNEPCAIDTARLLTMTAQTGGGAKHTGGIALL